MDVYVYVNGYAARLADAGATQVFIPLAPVGKPPIATVDTNGQRRVVVGEPIRWEFYDRVQNGKKTRIGVVVEKNVVKGMSDSGDNQ